MLHNGLEECNCKRTKCERFGKCDECLAHHKEKGKPPFCEKLKDKKKHK